MQHIVMAEGMVIFQIVIDVCLVVMFMIVLRQTRCGRRTGQENLLGNYENRVEEILKEGRKLAQVFEKQIIEKKSIIRNLNEGLDTRIIGLNLLTNRADAVLKYGTEEKSKTGEGADMCEIQDNIISMAEKGIGTDEITKKLGISKGEVEMVISLKRKLKEMEKVENVNMEP